MTDKERIDTLQNLCCAYHWLTILQQRLLERRAPPLGKTNKQIAQQIRHSRSRIAAYETILTAPL